MGDPAPNPVCPCPGAALYLANCRDVLPTLPAGSVDLVFTDPPYPCIQRSYGTWTEGEWWELMRAVVPECMRVLKPTGSAVFVLQPNSERVGRMRTWHLEFQLWVAKTWGIVQDAYWWNVSALPTAGACNAGLMKAAVKECVWVGPPDCFRDQVVVLWGEAELTTARRQAVRAGKQCHSRPSPSGHHANNRRMFASAARRGGVVPMNLLPIPNAAPADSPGATGHGAGTPFDLCWWWTRYLCPPGGSVLDPFSGTATTGLAALKHGCDYTGIERIPEYQATACRRLADAAGPLFATPAAGVVP
jgi:DNA modification methylase